MSKRTKMYSERVTGYVQKKEKNLVKLAISVGRFRTESVLVDHVLRTYFEQNPFTDVELEALTEMPKIPIEQIPRASHPREKTEDQGTQSQVFTEGVKPLHLTKQTIMRSKHGNFYAGEYVMYEDMEHKLIMIRIDHSGQEWAYIETHHHPLRIVPIESLQHIGRPYNCTYCDGTRRNGFCVQCGDTDHFPEDGKKVGDHLTEEKYQEGMREAITGGCPDCGSIDSYHCICEVEETDHLTEEEF